MSSKQGMIGALLLVLGANLLALPEGAAAQTSAAPQDACQQAIAKLTKRNPMDGIAIAGDEGGRPFGLMNLMTWRSVAQRDEIVRARMVCQGSPAGEPVSEAATRARIAAAIRTTPTACAPLGARVLRNAQGGPEAIRIYGKSKPISEFFPQMQAVRELYQDYATLCPEDPGLALTLAAVNAHAQAFKSAGGQ